MVLVKVTCTCGKDLGSYVAEGGVFGISDMQQGERHQIDQDCRSCNKNYDKTCKKCYTQDINKEGVCRKCGAKI
jgi:hypothetical protein